MLGRHQARKHLNAAGRDVEVVIAAAKALAAAFGDAQPAPLGTVIGRELVQMDHAVRDGVDRAVGALGGEVVERDHGRFVAGEVVLQAENLPAVAQRALRQQPDFRQAVDHDALRLVSLDRLEDALHGFAELEVGRIEQALVLLGIEHALRRHQLADLDAIVDAPAMRGGAFPQFLLGFGQADIEAGLAGSGAGKQELQRNGGLSGARSAFEQMQAVPGEAAFEHVIEAANPGLCTGQNLAGGCHRIKLEDVGTLGDVGSNAAKPDPVPARADGPAPSADRPKA